MKKALVFVAAFALVLVAGAAVAFMASPGDDAADSPEAVEKSTTTTSEKVKETTPTTEKVEETEAKEDSPKAEAVSDDSKKETEEEREEAKEPEDTTPPDLVILFPEDGQHFDEQKIAFEGKTEPGAKVYAGDYEADVDEAGNWRIVLILTNKGGNVATFKAFDEAGNESVASVKAYYDAAPSEKASESEKAKEEERKEEEKEKEEPKSYEFSATQKYGSCSENPPFDKWYGTGEPGTKVTIASPYGSGSTEIGKYGEWIVKVHFEGVECGQTFEVVLETDKGHRKTYSFTRLCDEPKDDSHDK